jgi:polyhydroxybutyrate depolymerase
MENSLEMRISGRKALVPSAQAACMALVFNHILFVGTAYSQMQLRPDPQTISINVSGQQRDALVYRPSSARPNAPIVIALHGGTRPATDIFASSTWAGLAAAEGFVLVAPQGINNQWNDGRGSTFSGQAAEQDDVGFIRALLPLLKANLQSPQSKVFVTGASNGGMMALRLACELDNEITAIGPVIAKLPVATKDRCQGKPAMPAIFISGTANPIMTFDGSPPNSPLMRRNPAAPMLSVPDTISFWLARNRCNGLSGEQRASDRDQRDGSTVSVFQGTSCAHRGALSFVRVNGGGHQQPSISASSRNSERGGSRLATRVLGPQNHDVDGPTIIWQFFKAQSGPPRS